MSISPELALAAAAAIGDKALQEQTKELLQLKRQLAESRKVEITGSGGRPVYAKGQFEDGEYRDGYEGVDDAASTSSFYSSRSWWDVHLTMCDENVGLFLINLQHLEIRLGGIVYATTSNDEVEGHDVIMLDNDCNDGNNDSSPKRSRNVMIPIQSGGGCRNATIQIDLKDMPEPPWKMLKSAISYNQNQSEYVFGELIDVFDIMISSRQLPQRLPEQVAELVGISFDTSSVRSMLSCLRDERKLT